MQATAYHKWWLGDTQADVAQILREEFAEAQKTTQKVIWVGAILFFLRGGLELLANVDVWEQVVARMVGTAWLMALCVCYGKAPFIKYRGAVYAVYLATFVSMVAWFAMRHNFHIAYLAVPFVLCLAFGMLMWPALHGIYWPVLAVGTPCMVMLSIMNAPTVDRIVYAFYLIVGMCFAVAIRRSRMRTAFTLFLFRQKLHTQTTHDPLTGLLNRTGWKDESGNLHSKCSALGQPLMVAFVDIDHFKKVNDVHGHNVGDEVIAKTAAQITKTLPPTAVIARIGGEEFVAAVPNVTHQEALVLAEKLRGSVENMRDPIPVTVSVGVSIAKEGQSISDVMVVSDKSLLTAKRTGRNRVCCDEIQPLPA